MVAWYKGKSVDFRVRMSRNSVGSVAYSMCDLGQMIDVCGTLILGLMHRHQCPPFGVVVKIRSVIL
jgi:hypothetical protein